MNSKMLVKDVLNQLEDVIINSYQMTNEYMHLVTLILKEIELYVGEMPLDNDIIHLFMQDSLKRKENANIGVSGFFLRKRLTNLIIRIINGESILTWKYERLDKKHSISFRNSILIEEYLSTLYVSDSTKRSLKYSAYKFIHFFESKNITDLSFLEKKDIYDYLHHIRFICNNVSNSHIYRTKSFVNYLISNNLSSNLNGIIIDVPASTKSHNYEIFLKSDIQSILECVDRNTIIGKRDYAILLLAFKSGLRSIDIAKIKLLDIDWYKLELHICQSKTSKTLVIPLFQDVSNAIAEYILSARPKTDDNHVFIRSKRPYQGICYKGTIQNIFLKYRKISGVTHLPSDGKTFHGIRRSLASWLLESNSNIFEIAQILGHTSISATKSYTIINSNISRTCALNINLIPIKGGYYHDL